MCLALEHKWPFEQLNKNGNVKLVARMQFPWFGGRPSWPPVPFERPWMSNMPPRLRWRCPASCQLKGSPAISKSASRRIPSPDFLTYRFCAPRPH
jgi:hypothetical protein